MDLLQNIIDNGVEKESGRANMPNTIGISNGIIKMNIQDGFPLLTTKKMFWKGIVHELLWILSGNTNIKYLVDNNVNIWNEDAYRWYLMKHAQILYNGTEFGLDYQQPYSMDVFIELIGKGELYQTIMSKETDHRLGDLGKVYGYQWRRKEKVFNDEQAPDYENKIEIIDQVKDCLDGLQKNPYSRYHIINAWDKADFKECALPPCHLLYQFIVRPLSLEERLQIYVKRCGKFPYGTEENQNAQLNDELIGVPKFYLDLNMYQRSCDFLLGVPFNLASMSCLLIIFAKTCNMLEGVSTWIGGDTHIYIPHILMIKEQLKRKPFELPKLLINKELHNLEDILKLNIDDFELINYQSHPAIKAELFTGLKK